MFSMFTERSRWMPKGMLLFAALLFTLSACSGLGQRTADSKDEVSRPKQTGWD